MFQNNRSLQDLKNLQKTWIKILYILLLNTPIIFQNYAVIAQIMLLSFWLNPEGFKKLLSVGTLWYKRVLKGLLLQDTEKQEFLLDVLQVLRIKAKFEQ